MGTVILNNIAFKESEYGGVRMNSFSVQQKKLNECVTELTSIYNTIYLLEKKINSIMLSMQENPYYDVKQALRYNMAGICNEKNSIQKMREVLENCRDLYNDTEKQIVLATSINNKKFNHASDVINDKDTSDTIKQTDNPSVNWLDKADKYIDSINDVVQQISSLSSKIQQAIQDATDLNAVVAIGLSGSVGGGGYLGGSVQIVVDMNGNVGLQFCGGTGVEAGVSADATAYAAVYPGKENITDIEGFGAETGGSLGEGFVGSASLLLEGEGNNMSPSGFLIGMGIGGEGSVAEGHAAISETLPTIKLGNILTRPVDCLIDDWNIVYKAWKLIA